MSHEKLERKLAYFANAMEEELKKNRAIKHSDTEYKKINAETLETATRHSKIMINAKRNELYHESNRKIAHAKVKAIAEFVTLRKKQIDYMFVEIAAALSDFTQKAEYENYLIESINTAKKAFNFSIIQLTPHDMRFENSIKTATGLIPETGNQCFIGGFILFNEKRSAMSDHTFETKLEIAKKEFAYDQDC